MDDLPIDIRNPAVRDYLSLIRLQVLTPLSLLINIAATVVCAFIVKPSLGGVSDLYPTPITPATPAIATYKLVIFSLQIGFCVLLVVGRKQETKQTFIKGWSGLALVFANWVMVLWSVAWVLKLFIVAAVLQTIQVLLLLYANIILLVYYPPTSSRPLDAAFIHAPLRLFLVLSLTVVLPHNLFIAVGLSWDPQSPEDYDMYKWEGFSVVFGLNLLGLVVIALRRDIAWCIGAVGACVSVWSARPKSMPVQATVITFTALHPLVLLASLLWKHYRPRREGVIALPPDEEREHHDDGEESPQQDREDPPSVWG